MSPRTSFRRKIYYLIAIAVLLMPLFWLSQPATNDVKSVPGSPGGKLAQLRDQYHLSQSQLGEIDPTSVTIKLATLGMRGVAANILWEKADEYQMKKDWTNRSAVLNQITKVQPNFINVWINQAWNLSFNISAQFDDYRERYRWVIKGIDFLKDGIKYNEREPRLPFETGWTIAHKIGKADESKEFRKLFKEDDDFNGSLEMALRDNWLVGRTWCEKAISMVEAGLPMMGKSPLNYLLEGPLCQMYYAEAVEKDGVFGEVAKRAWVDAGKQWHHYGTQQIPTSYVNDKTQQPVVIQLGEQEMHEQAAKKLLDQLEALQPGLHDKLVAEKRAALSKAQREALGIPYDKRTARQAELAAQAQQATDVTHGEVARRIVGPHRKEAIKLADEINEHETLARYIQSYRQIINFVYWRLRAEVEQTEELLAARKALHQGDQAYADTDLIAARNAYRQGLQGWRSVLDKHPSLVKEEITGNDLMDVIKRYRRILGQLDEPFPEKFILQDVLDAHSVTTAPVPANKGA